MVKKKTEDNAIQIIPRVSGIERAFNILEQVEGTRSRNEKEGYLKSGMDIPQLKTLLIYAYEPSKLYYIKKLPDDRGFKGKVDPRMSPDERFDYFIEKVLDNLVSRRYTGHTALDVVAAFMVSCTPEEQKWYSRVIEKDLAMGASSKTINKVFGKNTITEYNCYLAETLEDMDDLPERFYLEPKLDGARINAYNEEDMDVYALTRNGKLVSGYDNLEAEIGVELPEGYVYDGEIITKNFNGTMEKLLKKESGKKGVLYVFDIVPVDDFKNEVSTMTQWNRKLLLTKLFKKVSSPSLVLVPNSRILYRDNPDDVEYIDQYYEECLENGYEGIMVKDADAVYQYKRSKSMLKIKPSKTYDLEVVDTIQGVKPSVKGVLAAVVVAFKGNTVHVGSGFSKAQRKYFWDNPNEILGKVIEVRAQEVTNNKKKTKSLRFPRFKSVRPDK